jgi:hypothetical protein
VVSGAETYQPETSPRRWAEMDGRFLNHVALVYQPGERALVSKLFELLGCDVRDGGGAWLSGGVDRDERDRSNNALYATEVAPEELAFQRRLAKSMLEGELAASRQEFEARRRRNPQQFSHFGIRLSEQEQADVLARIDALDDPELEGRVQVRMFRPEDPDSLSPKLIQAFVFTDIVSLGMMPTGILLELQVVVD